MTRIERFALWCIDHLAKEKKEVVPSDIDNVAWEQGISLEPEAAVRALRKLEYGGFVRSRWVQNPAAPFPEARYLAYRLTPRGAGNLWRVPVDPREIFLEEER